MSCLLAVATATPYGYYQGGYSNVVPAAYTYGSRSTYVQPAYSHQYAQPAYQAAFQPVTSGFRSVFTQPAYSQQYVYQPATYAKPTAFTAFYNSQIDTRLEYKQIFLTAISVRRCRL